jgi:hypothetical protein
MEKILVISDTHKNLSLLKQVLINEIDADTILHLGDFYEDLDIFGSETAGKTIVKVPGIFHPKYKDGSLSPTAEYESGSWKMLLVHDAKDAHIRDEDILLFGHTHNRQYHKEGDIHLINPGHLKSSSDKGRAPSYAVFFVDEAQLEIQFFSLERELIEEINITK